MYFDIRPHNDGEWILWAVDEKSYFQASISKIGAQLLHAKLTELLAGVPAQAEV